MDPGGDTEQLKKIKSAGIFLLPLGPARGGVIEANRARRTGKTAAGPSGAAPGGEVLSLTRKDADKKND